MKTLNILKYIFAICGAGMFVGAIFISLNTVEFLKTALTTQGTVVELQPVRSHKSTTYKPVVDFIDVKGVKIEFASGSSSNPPSYEVGEKVEVLYNPKEPQDAKIKSFFSLWMGPLIVGIVGAVFFAVGFSFFISEKKKRDLTDFLKQNGTKIETDFQSVGLNTSVKLNGRSPFQIISQWQNPATSKMHIFASDDIWFDPTNFIKTNIITVIIDKNNPKKYQVDLSFLPESES